MNPARRMSSRGIKEKGRQWEHELAAYLNERIFDGREQVSRMPMSGAATFGTALGGADLMGLPGLHVEAKRTERLDIRGALRQAMASASKTKESPAPAPVVITRRNREAADDAIVAMRLQDFARILRRAYAATGRAYPQE